MPKTRRPSTPPAGLSGGTLAAGDAYLAAPMADLATRTVLWAAPETPVAEAARRMQDADHGSILVRAPADDPDHTGPGIVTDRDLRRVLADGLDPCTPVSEVASRPLLTLETSESVAAAHLAMLEAGVHHLALVGRRSDEDDSDRAGTGGPGGSKEEERIVGVISSTDLHRHQSRGPFFVLHRLGQDGQGPEGRLYRDYVRHRTSAVRSLRQGGVAADRIGHIASHLDDHLVRRCLAAEMQAIEAESGPLRSPWAWVAFGSDGRREQPVLLDQHNALIFDLDGLGTDEAAEVSEIFHRLAARVSERLLYAGWPEPNGGFVAGRWCANLAEWRRRFDHWLEEPDAEALEHAQVFFDLRRVAGSLDLDPVATFSSVEPSPEFLRLLTAMAVRRRPAVRTWRGLRKNDDGEIDLIDGGLRPLVALARVAGLCLALASPGTWAVSTGDRLAAAGRYGLLQTQDSERLTELYAVLTDRVLDLHLARPGDAHRGVQPSVGVRPGDLSRHERRRLASDLRFLRRQQKSLDSLVRRFLRSETRRGAGG